MGFASIFTGKDALQKWVPELNAFAISKLGPRPEVVYGSGEYAGELYSGDPEAAAAWDRRYQAEVLPAFEASLSPERRAAYLAAKQDRSDTVSKSNSISKALALGTIGLSAGGAALTGAGVIGGAAPAAATPAAVAPAGTATLPSASSLALSAGTSTPMAAIPMASTISPGAIMAGTAVPATTAAASWLTPEIAKLGLAGIGTLAGYASSKSATDAAKGATAAAQSSADAATQLGRDQLAFSMRQYDEAAPYREAAAKTAQQVSEAQLAQMKQQEELAREYAEYNRTTFRPLEQSIVADAQNYDTPAKREAAATSAIADVNKRFASVNDATARRLAASGIDPGSTRAMSVMDGQAIEQAKAGAGAAYTARKGVETTGFARKMDAASLGRNLPSSQATSAQIALTSGNNATGNAGAALAANNSGVPQVQNAYNSAVQSNVAAGGLYSSAAQLAQRAGVISDAQWGALGDSMGNWANSKGGTATLNKWFGG